MFDLGVDRRKIELWHHDVKALEMASAKLSTLDTCREAVRVVVIDISLMALAYALLLCLLSWLYSWDGNIIISLASVASGIIVTPVMALQIKSKVDALSKYRQISRAIGTDS